MLLVDIQRVLVKVHTVPGQAEDFALTKPGEDGDKEHQLIRIAFDRPEKPGQILFLHGLNLSLLDPRQRHGIQRILPDIAHLLRLRQRPVEDAVHVLDRLGRQPLFVLKGVVHGLDHGGGELAKLGLADIGDDVQLDVIGIRLDCRRFDIADIVPEPDGEPFGKLDGIRFNIGAFIDFACDLGELLADFLLRFAID